MHLCWLPLLCLGCFALSIPATFYNAGAFCEATNKPGEQSRVCIFGSVVLCLLLIFAPQHSCSFCINTIFAIHSLVDSIIQSYVSK